MKLNEYIKKHLKEIDKIEDIKSCEIEFNLGVDTDMNISQKSSNRVKFTVVRKKNG